jgi:hypothetical protein
MHTIRVHRCFTTEIHTEKEDYVKNMELEVLSNVSMADVLALYKGKLMKRKFLITYFKIINSI